jgi:RsiW-degrading membrane proteinase PrsW (M82 family)
MPPIDPRLAHYAGIHPLVESQDYTVRTTLFSGTTLLILLILMGGVMLYASWEGRRTRKQNFFQYAFSRPLTWIACIGMLFIVGVNMFVNDPDPKDPASRVLMGEVRDLPELAEAGYKVLIEKYPDSLDLHMQYIENHFNCSYQWGRKGGKVYTRNDRDIQNYYHEKIYTEDQNEIGNMGSAVCYYYLGNHEEALFRLDRVNHENLKYVNFFRARMEQSAGNPNEADSLYRKEIETNGYKKGAYALLSAHYFKTKNYAKLSELGKKEDAIQFIPSEYLRYAAIMNNDPVSYFSSLFKEIGYQINWPGFIAALLILLLWTLYVRSIDLFSPERWSLVVFTILAGALCAIMALPLYDVVNFIGGFDMNGRFFNDLLYCIFGIGMIEEIVKIIPLLIYMALTKRLKEPADYIVFGCFSALGFATLENILYFQEESHSLYYGRALVSVTGHMCYTSVIAYFIILAKYRFRQPMAPFFLAGLLIAATIHGLFDFFIFWGDGGGIVFLSIVIHLLSLMLLGFFINNALNHSPFSKGEVGIETSFLAQNLVGGLVLVLLFEFFVFALFYGPNWANYKTMTSIFTGSYSVAFAALNLSNIDVMSGEWLKFRPRFKEFRNNYNKAVGLRVKLKPIQGSEKLILPNGSVTGKILQRVKLNRDNRYYLLKLDQPVSFFNRDWDVVLIRPKSNTLTIEPGEPMLVYFIVVLDWRLLAAKQKDRSFFRFIDWAWAEAKEDKQPKSETEGSQ